MVMSGIEDYLLRIPVVAVFGHSRTRGSSNIVVDHDRAGRAALGHLRQEWQTVVRPGFWHAARWTVVRRIEHGDGRDTRQTLKVAADLVVRGTTQART